MIRDAIITLMGYWFCFMAVAGTGDCLSFHVISSEPIGYVDKDNQKTGAHWSYLEAIEKESGLCINKQIKPYARIWQSMKVGLHDGGIAFRSESRSELVDYVAPIRAIKTVVIPIRNKRIGKYDDLYGLVIGKVRGAHLGQRFDSDPNIKIRELVDYESIAHMVKHERVDAIAGGALMLTYQLNKYGALEHVEMDQRFVIGEKVQWLQLSKAAEQADKVERLRSAIEELQQKGTFDQIVAQFYGSDWHLINQ